MSMPKRIVGVISLGCLFLLTVAMLTAERNLSVLLLLLPAYLTIVCGKRSESKQIVASAKVVEPIVEEWTPDVIKPDAKLADLPIETIEGIGPVYGSKLRKAGIETVHDLLETSTEKIVKICKVSEEQAQRWVAMSRFCWLESISEEDAEAIVYGTGITTLRELADANPEEILAEIKQAVELGHVQVPSGYQFTIEMVKKWIAEAKELVVK